jgi:predicted nucleic acid-binding protein
LTCVVDASVVISALISHGPESRWAEELLRSEEIAAPHFMPSEAANLIRRSLLFRDVNQTHASRAHDELLALSVTLFPFAPYGERVWQLRNNLSAYDAWYVALAEDLRVPLVTLDGRLIRSPGPRCEFVTFPG